MGIDYKYDNEKYLLIGHVSKAHGMRGEVKIICFSEEPEQLSNYKSVVLVDKKGSLSPVLAIKATRPQGKVAITLLDTIWDRNRAEYIEGMGVLLDRNDLPEIEAHEYYWDDMIGKEVEDTEGNKIGVITNMFSNGAQDIFVITVNGEEILIPVVADIVLETSGKTVVIAPPAGLIEMNQGI